MRRSETQYDAIVQSTYYDRIYISQLDNSAARRIPPVHSTVHSTVQYTIATAAASSFDLSSLFIVQWILNLRYLLHDATSLALFPLFYNTHHVSDLINFIEQQSAQPQPFFDLPRRRSSFVFARYTCVAHVLTASSIQHPSSAGRPLATILIFLLTVCI